MTRRRHPKKDVEKALQYAEERRCEVRPDSGKKHWGWIIAPNGEEFCVYSTPQNPSGHAKRIRSWVDKNT
jgi:hypothetical protein